MRYHRRAALDDEILEYLQEKQAEVDDLDEPSVVWRRERRTAAMKRVEATLEEMVKPRARCMYCQDSRAMDIEHYRPKTVFPQETFVWPNLLWICAKCNREKGIQFPETDGGDPLLVDPTADDPWNVFVLDSATALLAPRWLDNPETAHPKAETTLEVIGNLLDEPTTEGRRRTIRALRWVVDTFLSAARRGEVDDPIDDNHPIYRDLVKRLEDVSGYGLVEWFFQREGLEEVPFVELAEEFPETLESIRERLAARELIWSL